MTCLRPIMTTVLGMAMLGSAYGKTLEEETPALVQALAKQLVAKQKPKVATLDFTDIQGRPNELGRFLAEQLAVDMVMAEGITVVDRANISAVMAEHQLTAEGLVKPENAKKLGEFAGVDALLIGNLMAMDNVFTLTVKAISTETAELVAAGRMKFDVTQDSMKQFSTVLSGGAGVTVGGSSASNGTPSSHDSDDIARKMFGNLEVVLKSAIPSSVQDSRGKTTPAISCSIELSNRDLRSIVVIAANGNKCSETDEITLASYRGGLRDSNGNTWQIPSGLLKGIPAVLCCDATRKENPYRNWGAYVHQSNPSAVVDYIKHGKKCELGYSTNQEILCSLGRFWTGSFATIPPGKCIRATAVFVTQNDQTTLPQFFEFGMELVMGSVATGGDPEEANDLRLENLTFDKIVMPTAAEKK